MKRILLILFSVIFCFSLCSCSTNNKTEFIDLVNAIGVVSLNSENAIIAAENAYELLTDEEKAEVASYANHLTSSRELYTNLHKINEVVLLINAIGEVSTDSEAAIIAAENAYALLSDEEKAQISIDSQKLTECRETYNSILKANEVVTLINAIGEVSLNSKNALESAERAYKNLSDKEKELVAEYGVLLISLRENYDALIVESRISEVEDSISAIGRVTLSSKSKIDKARELYNALTYEEKNMVENYSTLTAAETNYKDLVKKEKEKTIKQYTPKFDIEKDVVQNITFYLPKSIPEYIDTKSYMAPYIGVANNAVWICVRYNYTASDWIFWENLIISVDGVRYNKSVNYFNIDRDVGGGRVWECLDEVLDANLPLDSSDLQMLQKIANSSTTIIRFEGDFHYYDYTVSNTDKQMIRDVLALYGALIG